MQFASASFARFVYPMLFDASLFEQLTSNIKAYRWKATKQPQPLWEQNSFPEDHLLAYVASYLNAPQNEKPTALLWRLNPEVLNSPYGIGARCRWQLEFSGGSTIPFTFTAFDFSLFRSGTGFLSMEVSLPTNDTSQWLDFLHYFRFANGQRGVGVRALRAVGRAEMTPFWPLFDNTLGPATGEVRHLAELIKDLLQTAGGGGSTAPWWQEVFVHGQVIPFAALFVDEVDADDISSLVFQAGNFFNSRQETHPLPGYANVNNSALLAYAKDQWFSFSLEGGAFIGCNAPNTPFWRETLPQHLRQVYFLIFILALQQRFMAIKLTHEICGHWLDAEPTERIVAFKRIRDALLEFTARSYFPQVVQRHNHHRYYLKWIELFQIQRLYRDVADGVRDMYGALMVDMSERQQLMSEQQQQQTRKFEQWISSITFLIGIPSFALFFLAAIPAVGATDTAIISAGAFLVGFALLIAMNWLRRS